MRVLQSQTDLSANFVEQSLEGFLESRYVRRNDKYFVCYLSSHNGCGYLQPTIYWSLYSVCEAFREKWLPGAMGVTNALNRLAEYQDHTKKLVKVHFAFIEGENDSEADIDSMCHMLETWKLHCEVNIVRYNPASPEQGRESSEDVVQARAAQLSQCPQVRAVKIVPRVGFDVKASCGMFVQGGK